MNKLSRKDIAMLEVLAVTEESKGKLAEYIQQREKAAKAYKAFREAVVNDVEVEKVVKPAKPKRKFKAGDKVRVLDTENPIVPLGLGVGDVTEVLKYSLGGVVVVKTPRQAGYAFRESSLELVEEKTPNELRAEIIQRAKEFVEENKHTTAKIGHRCHSVSFGFAVNPEKRRVIALTKGLVDIGVQFEGVAECSPDDVYNEHIGKAIALGRALGKDVSEFESAVQPDKEVIGTVLRATFNYKNGFSISDSVIWNDTDAIYKECVE